MTQLFLIVAFVLGFITGWKTFESLIINGIVFLASQNDSGVKMDENGNKITIDTEVLNNFNLNKENIN